MLEALNHAFGLSHCDSLGCRANGCSSAEEKHLEGLGSRWWTHGAGTGTDCQSLSITSQRTRPNTSVFVNREPGKTVRRHGDLARTVNRIGMSVRSKSADNSIDHEKHPGAIS
jgi:hypothetical protein